LTSQPPLVASALRRLLDSRAAGCASTTPQQIDRTTRQDYEIITITAADLA
jgi:hypothetical protein